MNKHNLQISNTSIHYIEKITDKNYKATIFFIHGNSGSVNMWQKQIGDPLFNQFRLIAFDLPGHGESSSLKMEQYNLPVMGAIMASAINYLNDGKLFFLAGFSMGAAIVCELVPKIDRPKGIILISPTIISNNISSANASASSAISKVMFSDDALIPEINAEFEKGCLSLKKDISMLVKSHQQAARGFRPSLAASVQKKQYNNHIEIIKKLQISILLIFAQDDPWVNPDYLDNISIPLWRDQKFNLKPGSHFINIERPPEINKLIFEYLDDMIIE